MKECKSDLSLIQEMLVDYDLRESWEQMDRLMALLDRVSERINHADYGYSGFFDAVKVREKELDRLYEFDMGILEDVEAFRRGILELKERMEKGNLKDVYQDVFRLRRVLDDIDKKFNERKEYMLEFR
ncbi:MAG: hypothetical protein QXN15_08615 [Candidatus Jordarchaeales archaeon]|nr:hypothetical protein [Candidatus Jordarchaeia archaeon]